jgi:hypothetical protein
MSTVTYVDRFNGVVGAGNLVRVDDSITGLSLFAGVCSGHERTGISGAAYLFGYNTGAAMYVNNVENLQPTLTQAQRIRSTMVDLTVSYLLGATAMRGFSGASGDFPRLFSRNWGGDTFTFLPVQANIANIRSIYDNIIINGKNVNYNITDFEGNVYSMATADIKNLYSDIVSYHSTAVLTGNTIKNEIQSAGTIENLNTIAGFTGEGFAVKIAPTIDEVGVLFISPKARATKKTTIPETKYIKGGLTVELGGEEFGG